LQNSFFYTNIRVSNELLARKGNRIMAKHCEICVKAPIKAAKRTFSNKQNVHTQEPNLHTVKAVVNGSVKRIRVCTSCIKAGKVTKA
jgi:large subunit ribosomal protein L28